MCKRVVPPALALATVVVLYLPTLQTTPNGGDHFYVADVGETQIVLNLWGTLHATGYPLYAIIGNVLADALKALPLWVANTAMELERVLCLG